MSTKLNLTSQLLASLEPIPNNTLRAYKVPDEQGNWHAYPSVTSILSYVMPPDLKKWAAKNSALAVARAQRQAVKDGMKLTQKQLVEIGLYEPFRMMKASQVRGVAVHQFAEDYFNGITPTPVSEDLQGYVDSFLRWTEFYKCKAILQEEVLFSHKYKFAGRMDFYGTMLHEGKEKRVLIDFKTANFPHSDWGLQLAAYAQCLIDLGFPVDEMYILHLKSKGYYDFLRFDDSFQDFLSLRKVFAWKAKAEKPEFEFALPPDEFLKQQKTA